MKKAIIIGAGPAGLTAALELLEKTEIQPVILEADDMVGGLSRTVNYKGNRIDIGGHRFFSKSDLVMNWWRDLLPLQTAPAKDDKLLGRDLDVILQGSGEKHTDTEKNHDPEKTDDVMLIRHRVSRIFFLRKFFNYPVSLDGSTIRNLGLKRIFKIGCSYLLIRIFPVRRERSLEDFFTNRFGKELYRTFFKDYTEKVWGVPCNEIKPEWGAQRVKGLSITKALIHAIKKQCEKNKDIGQKGTETSLIEKFIYPKHGPGQLWEQAADQVRAKGGTILLNHRVTKIHWEDNRVQSIEVENGNTGETIMMEADYLLSSMPVRDLVHGMGESVPEAVRKVAEGLQYRDFMTVGLLLNKMKIKNETLIPTVNNIVPDNWIYIQERDVKVGRLQIFNNWSPYMVNDLHNVWIGLEYFCNEGDELWGKPDDEFIQFATCELEKIGIIDQNDVLDAKVIRMKKAYPAYFGTYEQFDLIREFVDKFENLYLMGRNGMHRYNNMDHSMLTAMKAVECVMNGSILKEDVWAVNTEEEYHEEKS
ncbi:MAG TPA: NAD(P)/FAD-dependent oxidoreductase [Bacillota bacterium]|nr:NAD(P)/FAD-dependent oxidoreductase [Bacillota bacterium]